MDYPLREIATVGNRGWVLRLRAFTVLAIFAIALSGCLTAQDRTAEFDAADRDKCISYGANPGTPAYTDCRLKLDSLRQQAAAAEASRPLPAPHIPSNCPTPASGRLHDFLSPQGPPR